MLAINSLIEWSWDDKSKTTERVLWLDRQHELVYLIDIDRNDVPVGRTLTEIETAITEGVASIQSYRADGQWNHSVGDHSSVRSSDSGAIPLLVQQGAKP